MTSINVVVLVGNLTRDPELNAHGICKLRVAVNDRVKDKATGEWQDRPNYFNVTVFGAQGERCAQYLARGSQVAAEGRLRWREWSDKDGNKREAVEVVADTVMFLTKATPRQEKDEHWAGADDLAKAAVDSGLGTPMADDDDIPF